MFIRSGLYPRPEYTTHYLPKTLEYCNDWNKYILYLKNKPDIQVGEIHFDQESGQIGYIMVNPNYRKLGYGQVLIEKAKLQIRYSGGKCYWTVATPYNHFWLYQPGIKQYDIADPKGKITEFGYRYYFNENTSSYTRSILYDYEYDHNRSFIKIP